MTRHSLILVVPLALSAGCELAGALIAAELGNGDDTAAGFATLAVTVESASGEVIGRTISPEMFEASGARFGEQLAFALDARDGSLGLEVQVPAESSSSNPYLGGPEGAQVLACTGDVCESATDFAIDVVQTESGRRAVIESAWDGRGGAELAIHFAER